MPNGNERKYECEICGKSPDDHAVLFGKCYTDKNSYYTPRKYISIPASLIDKVRALCVEADNYDLMLCSCCKRLNPQHKDCTSCSDRDDLIKSIAAVREALAEIEGGSDETDKRRTACKNG